MPRRSPPSTHSSPLPILGWREWLTLPTLELPPIKAKVDTGARTSALHAFAIELYDCQGEPWVRFQVHPRQRDSHCTVTATAPLLGERWVRSSNGDRQRRPVITTLVVLGDYQWPIELTLTNRDAMGFRMLLGRAAVRRRFLVDPERSYLLGKPSGH